MSLLFLHTMHNKKICYLILVSVIILSFYTSCNEENQVRTRIKKVFNYSYISSIIKSAKANSKSDSSNVFDQNEFDPFTDSLSDLLATMKTQLEQDSLEIVRLGLEGSGLLDKTTLLPDETIDSSMLKKDTFTNDIRTIQQQEIKALKFNLEQFKIQDSLQPKKTTGDCRQNQCRVWAQIIKSKQKLYLHVDGVLVDSFKVSTGDIKHETPTFDTRPSGPMFKKYTSKKFPGGNYNGLGNMPYVVFISGGVAIHGTTTGNIARLGKKASHGCVRLHPDNGKLFFELVKSVGISNTWITIKE